MSRSRARRALHLALASLAITGGLSAVRVTTPSAASSAAPPTTPGGNQPPSVPVLRNPSETVAATTTTPVFSWVASTDPEGDQILYEIEVHDDRGGLIASLGVRGTVTSLAQELENRGRYSWRARAIDAPGLASEFSPANTFVVVAPIDEPEVVVNGAGCGASRAPGPGAPIAAAGALLALARRRRRRRIPSE